MRGMDRVDNQKLFPSVEESITRGIGLRCEGQGLKEMYKAGFFTQRVVGAWNTLPGKVVEADTIVTFKMCLDKYMNSIGIEGYGPRKGRRF